MARSSSKQTEIESTDDINFKMRRSFSWDREFFISDGFLNDDELSSIVEGGGDDVKHQLQKIEEIESLEAKLFQEIEASTQTSIGTSNVTSSGMKSSAGKKDCQAKKIRPAPTGPSSSSTSVKTLQPTRSSSSSGCSVGNKVKSKSPARRSASSKTDKPRTDSPSKRSGGVTTKSKVGPVATRLSRTPPASPVSSGSSSSTFSVNQRSKRGSSVPRRSTVSSEKPAARKNDDWKTSKPVVRLIPKTQSSISLKIKPPPVVSHPSPGLLNASTSSTDQKSKAIGNKGSTDHHRSKSTLKNRPTGQTSERNGKQSAASGPGTRSPSASRTRKLSSPKTVAAVNTGLKPISPKTNTPKPSRKQSSAKAKSPGSIARGVENIVLVSPEVMDIKGKLNALKMEISMQKKERCKETKTSRNESGKGESSSMIQMNNQTKRK